MRQVTRKQDVREFFTATADYWNDIYTADAVGVDCFNSMTVKGRQEQVVRIVCDRRPQGVILDVGCGAGVLVERLQGYGQKVVGLDISFEMAKRTRARNGSRGTFVGVVQGDTECLPFKPCSIACVVSSGVLQYLERDETVVPEMCRIVGSGGFVVCTTPNLIRLNTTLDPYYYTIRAFDLFRSSIRKRLGLPVESSCRSEYRENRNFGNRRFFPGQLNRYFAREGFSRSALVGIGYGPVTFLKKRVLREELNIALSALLEKLSRGRLGTWLTFFATRFVTCYEGEDRLSHQQ